MSRSSDESFLARWSRLKGQPDAADVAADEGEACAGEPTSPSSEATRSPPKHAEPNQAEPDWSRAQHPDETTARGGAGEGDDGGASASKPDSKPEFRDFSNFDFEKLDFNSDYTQFMKDDVPEAARKRALRQLWISNPVLANMDGLDDYCEDYTDAAMVPAGGIRTAYKIGKGFLSDGEVAQWQALGQPPDAAEVAAAGDGNGSDAAEPSEDGEGPASALADDTAGVDEASANDDAGALIDRACGDAGAACGAFVKHEEQVMLDAYDAAAKDAAAKDGEVGPKGAISTGSHSGRPTDKDQSIT